MERTKFIILNLLATIIEIGLVLFFIIRFVVVDSTIFGYILLSIYAVFLVFMIILSFGKHNVFNTIDFPEELKSKIDEMHVIFNEKYPNTNIEFLYVEDDNFIEPAAYLSDRIYVNSKYKFSPIFFEAILAHELGHAQSKLITLRIVHLLRISSAISRLIYSFRVKNQAFFKKKFSIVFDMLVFAIYNLFNIFDHIVSNSFFRKDEIKANSIAIALGYGDSLRYFYYFNYINASQEGLLVRKYYDYKHPSTKQMLELMELDMNLDESEIDVFAVHKKIREVRNISGLKDKNNKILQWYQYKATSNDPYYLYELGIFYSKGKHGIAVDNELALDYFELAKKQDYTPAFYQIALYHYNRKDNDIEAFEYFKFAAENEFMLAYKYYAECLAYGIGTMINNEQAQVWYRLAAQNGDKEAINYLSFIGNTFLYDYHTNKLAKIEEDSYICESVFSIDRVVADQKIRLHAKFQRNLIILFDEAETEFGRFGFTGDKLVRRNVLIHETEDVIYKTTIVYKRQQN